MLNRKSLFRGETALTARQRQTAVFVGGIVALLGAIVLSFTGVISALIHRDDPVAMQAVSSEGTATTTAAVGDGTADAGLDRVAPDLGGAESGAATPSGDATAPAAGDGRFTGTYKPSKGASSPSPLAPTATRGGDPAPTTPTTQAPGATTASTAAEPTSTATTGAPSSSTTTTRPPTTTTTTRVTVTEATVPPTVITTATTRPPTTSTPTSPPSSAPPSSPTVIPGPVA